MKAFAFLGNAGWVASSKLCVVAVQLVSLVILARYISPSDFGVYGVVSLIVSFLTIITAWGQSYAIIKEKVFTREVGSKILSFNVYVGLIGSVLLFLCGDVLARIWKQPDISTVLSFGAIDCFLRTAAVGPMALLQRYKKFKLLAIIDVVSVVVGVGFVGVYMGITLRNYWALVIGAIVCSGLRQLMLMYVLRGRFSISTNIGNVGTLLQFGGGMTIARLLNYAALNVDNLIVSRFLGMDAFGMYGRAYNLMSQPVSLVTEVYDKLMYPYVAKSAENGLALNVLYIRSMRVLAWIVMPGSVLGVILAEPLVSILLGSKWIGVVGPLAILMAGMFSRVGYAVPLIFSRVLGSSAVNIKAQGVYAVSILIGVSCGVHFGVIGVSIGVLFGLTFCNILFQILYVSNRGIRVIDLLKQCCLPAVMSVSLGLGLYLSLHYIINHFNSPDASIVVVVSVFVYIAVFLLVCLALKYLMGYKTWKLLVVGDYKACV